MASLSGLHFRALGTLEVYLDGTPLAMGKRRTRAVLAMLLMSANEIVPSDRLTDHLWPDVDTKSARHSLHVAISDLRHCLAHTDGALARERRLATVAPGYMLRVAPDEFDVSIAERLAREGSRALASDDHQRADRLLTEASSLWHGSPYADFMYEEFAAGEIRRLNELELTIIEDLMAAELALGRHHEHIAKLEELVDREPTRERLLRQLMLALYRSERAADAIAAFERARSRLAADYDMEPEPELVALAGRIRSHGVR